MSVSLEGIEYLFFSRVNLNARRDVVGVRFSASQRGRKAERLFLPEVGGRSFSSDINIATVCALAPEEMSYGFRRRFIQSVISKSTDRFGAWCFSLSTACTTKR
jgi:hypothetical protein